LGNYGGPTQTIALLPGSPALAAGGALLATEPPLDQRGLSRPSSGQIDIGAYQTQASPFVVTTAADPGGISGKLSLREAVNLANAYAAAGSSATITFDPAAMGTSTVTLTQGLLDVSGTGGGTETIDGGGIITVSGNHASRVFQVDTGVLADLTALAITAGQAAGNGGGVLNIGTLTVSNSTLSGNSANRTGGGIENAGTLTVTDATLSGNSAGFDGGGIDNSGTLTVTDSTLSGNSTSGDGGGISNEGTLTVSNSTFSGNSTGHFIGNGGGILNKGTLTVSNSTFSGNSAVLSGGGIFSAVSSTLTVSNSTLSGNSAAGAGGGIDNVGTLTLQSTIVAGNTATSGGPDVNGTVVATSADNLIGNGSGLSGISDGDANGNLVGHAALLAPLGNYGGPTQTFALLPVSPALAAGGPLAVVTSAAMATDTTLSVSDASTIASGPCSILIQVGAEEMLVTNVNLTTNTLTVTRGVNGTQATAHAVNDPILLATDQRGLPRPASAEDIGAFQTQNTATAVTDVTVTYNSSSSQTITLMATVTDNGKPMPEALGMVTFTVGMQTASVAINAQGVASTQLVLAAGYPAGKITIQATYTDSSGTFTTSTGSGTLQVLAANVTTTAAAAAATYSTANQPVMLSASIANTSNPADTVNAGMVTFTVVDAHGTQVGSTVQGPVNSGSASASFSLPAGSAAGSYAVKVSYADPAGNFTDAGDTSSTLTVSPANVTTRAARAILGYSTTTQTAELTASVTNISRPADGVPAGVVTFTVVDVHGNTVGTAVHGSVTSGVATAAFTVPAAQAAGTYIVKVSYADPAGNFTDAGDSSGALIINNSVATSISITSATVTPALFYVGQTESVTAHVSTGNNAVVEGTVTFTLSGMSMTAPVDGAGNATGLLPLPLLTGAFPQVISVGYADSQGKLASSDATTTARWSPWAVLFPADVFAPSNVQFPGDGSQVMTANFFGLPLLLEMYDAQSRLVELDFGLFHWSFTYDGLAMLVGVSLNGASLL
jgi:hypothetical protein